MAVLHGPAEIGYLAASEPMVNIRETLALAETKGILAPESRRSLERFAKSLYFGERNWPALLAAAASRGVAETRVGGVAGLAAERAGRSEAVGRAGDARGDAGVARGRRTGTPGVSFRMDVSMGSISSVGPATTQRVRSLRRSASSMS